MDVRRFKHFMYPLISQMNTDVYQYNLRKSVSSVDAVHLK